MTDARRVSPLFAPYIGVVTAAGVAVFAVGAVFRAPEALRSVDRTAVVLAVLLVLAELRPVTFHRRGGSEWVSLSGAFACALVLHADWSLVVLVQALASVVDDARNRTAWWKASFNVAQYTLSLVAAWYVFAALSPAPAYVSAHALPAAIAACAAFFVLNTCLPGAAFALRERMSVLRSFLEDLPFQASVGGVVVVMAPLVLTVADDSLWLVALLLVPVVAVHRGAVASLERAQMSLRDALTGLPNQIAFQDSLGEQLEEAQPDGRHVAVLALSLDHFSDVNRTLGHAAGDDLLRQVAVRLRAAVPEQAVLARAAGGGFLISVPDLASPWAASTCAEQLLQQFSDPYALAESAFALRASVGLTVAPLHGTDPDRLMQHAEVARDLARRSRTGLEVYSVERDEFTARRMTVLRGLGPALRRREMTVHFQPQVDLGSGAVTGYEALLRWEHPELGRVGPDEFVALAEYAGMMQEITDYVLDEALRSAAEWRSQGCHASVSVNVSASVLQDPELPARVMRRLALWGVPSSALVLEITETAVMSDPERCRQILRELRALRVGLSLDDYGTGYASLAYLTTLPVDELKIDKSFVLAMLDSSTDRAVVRSTLDLARTLGLRVVAEGVETAELAELLASYGCRMVQGYHYGYPMPPSELVLDLTLPVPTATIVPAVDVVPWESAQHPR